jgi:O-antigen/teichoic acid export membrane protein
MGLFTLLRQKAQQYPAIKSVGVYTAINFLTKGVSFLLLFIYTQPRYILPEENGLLNLFSSSILFLMPFLSMGILQSTSTDFYKLDKPAFNDFFTTNLLLPTLVLILSMGGFFIARQWFSSSYGFPLSFMLLIPLITYLTYINEQLTLMLRVNNDLRRYTAAGIAKIVLEFGLSVALVVFIAMRWQGRLTGIVVSYGLLGLYAFYYFYKKGYLSGRFQKKYIKSELVYAVPVLAMQVAIFSLNTADKFMLAKVYKDNGVVGIYSIACTFASIITIFCSAYLGHLFPSIYQTLSAPDVQYGKIKKDFLNYVKIMALATVGVIVATPLLYRFFIHPKYHPALGYFYILAIGAFVWAVTFYFYAFLLFYKQKRKLLLLSVLITLCSLPCVYVFARHWGDKGAAIGVLISYAISFLLTCFFTREHIRKLFNG